VRRGFYTGTTDTLLDKQTRAPAALHQSFLSIERYQPSRCVCLRIGPSQELDTDDIPSGISTRHGEWLTEQNHLTFSPNPHDAGKILIVTNGALCRNPRV